MSNVIDARDKSSLIPDLNKYCAVFIDGESYLIILDTDE